MFAICIFDSSSEKGFQWELSFNFYPLVKLHVYILHILFFLRERISMGADLHFLPVGKIRCLQFAYFILPARKDFKGS